MNVTVMLYLLYLNYYDFGFPSSASLRRASGIGEFGLFFMAGLPEAVKIAVSASASFVISFYSLSQQIPKSKIPASPALLRRSGYAKAMQTGAISNILTPYLILN